MDGELAGGGHVGPLFCIKSGAIAGGVDGSDGRGAEVGAVGVVVPEPPPKKRLTPFMAGYGGIVHRDEV